MGDLKRPGWMYLKGGLFAGIAVCASALLIFRDPALETVVLIGLIVWSSSRAYYFMFYVIAHYIDGDYRFSGVGSFVRYVMEKKKRSYDKEKR